MIIIGNLYDYDNWNYFDGFSEYGELTGYEHRKVKTENINLEDNVYVYRETFDMYGIYKDEYMDFSGKMEYGVMGEKKLLTYYKYGFVDINGILISQAIFDTCHVFKEGFAAVAKKLKVDLYTNKKYIYKWGFVNKQGTNIVPHIFDEVHDFKNGHARVRIKQQWSFINKSGNLITDLSFDDAENFYHTGEILVAKVQFEGKWGIISKYGQYLLVPSYDYIKTFDNSKFIVAASNGVYYLFSNFIGITNFKNYSYIDKHSDELFLVVDKNKYGLINQKGDVVIQCIYDSIEKLDNKLNVVSNGSLLGIVDNNGNTILDCKCDSIGRFENGVSCVRINKLWGLIDTNGYFYIEPKFQNVWNKLFKDLKDKAIMSLNIS